MLSLRSAGSRSTRSDYMSRYQFFQNEIGKVEIKAVPINGLKITSEMKKEIEDTFNKRTNEGISFTVQVVNQIKPKGNGKTSIIEQKLNIEEYLS